MMASNNTISDLIGMLQGGPFAQGLPWEKFRRSTNVEDNRSEMGRALDSEMWAQPQPGSYQATNNAAREANWAATHGAPVSLPVRPDWANTVAPTGARFMPPDPNPFASMPDGGSAGGVASNLNGPGRTFFDMLPADPRMQANFARNQPYIGSRPANYNTSLGPQEPAFRQWLTANNVPFDPNAGVSDYDMRGFYQGLQNGDPRAQSAIDPNDSRLHYPDTWKTPYHETFSNQSQWAGPVAPQWNDQDQLVSPSARILFDDKNQGQGGGLLGALFGSK